MMEPYSLNARWFFLVFFAIFHFAVAAMIAHTRLRFVDGPVRVLSVLLFVLNGFVTLGAAAREMVPFESWSVPALQLFDDPTGLVILLLGLHLWRNGRPMGRPWLWIGVPVLLWMVTLGLRAAQSLSTWEVDYVGLTTAKATVFIGIGLMVPVVLYAGYGVLVVATAVRLVHARSHGERIFMVLLLAAFVPRVIEFSMLYGYGSPLTDPAHPFAVNFQRAMQVLLARAMGPVAAVVLVWAAYSHYGRTREWSTSAYLGLMGVAGLALGLGTGLVTGQAGYLAGVLSLVVIRPLLVGAAFSRKGTADALLVTSALFVVFVGVHALVNLLFGLGFFELDEVIMLTIALVLALVPVAWHAALRFRALTDRFGSLGAGAAASGAGGAPGPVLLATAAPARADVLLAFLARHPDAAPGSRGVLASTIEAETALAAKNLARLLKQIERNAQAAGLRGPVVESREVGARGQKAYALSPEGVKWAADLTHAPAQ